MIANHKKVIILLFVLTGISLFFHSFKINQVPSCINADEAALGYNAYSILKTGRDEYGNFLPLRLRSFEDYKLPLYSYLSVPLIAQFGLNIFSVRAVNIIIGLFFPLLTYLLIFQLYKNRRMSLIGAALITFSPWTYFLSRQAHEGVASVFFILIAFLLILRYQEKPSYWKIIIANIALLLASLAYQTGRIFLMVFFFYQFLVFFKEHFGHKLLIKNSSFSKIKFLKNLAAPVIAVGLFFATDIIYGVSRVSNLFFINNKGFHARIMEYLSEHPLRFVHNKYIESIKELTDRYFMQISPDFFITNGDFNPRFGFTHVGLITPIEYVFIFIGIYFLFKNREKFRYLILILAGTAPLGNVLTWQGASLIRTFFLIFPLIILIAYGVYYFIISLKRRARLFLICGILVYLFYLGNSWDVYFFHYPKRAYAFRLWQCGYKEMVDYVNKNYNKFDEFVITDRVGQPYIFFLFYANYPPRDYQKVAKISAPDNYGFGQVEKFDKFNFRFHFDMKSKGKSYIALPDQFGDLIQEDLKKIKKIFYKGEELFWIYET